MQNDELKKLKQEERAFLHDIATPIGTSALIVDLLTERMKELGNRDEELAQLDILQKSLERLTVLIRDRRQVVIKMSED